MLRTLHFLSFFSTKVEVKYSTACAFTNGSSNVNKVVLSCETGKNIVIVKADFGRDKYSIACDDKYYDGNCTSRVDTEQELRRLCGTRQSCEVKASLLVDPCPGVIKILRVWYQCVGEGEFFILIIGIEYEIV